MSLLQFNFSIQSLVSRKTLAASICQTVKCGKMKQFPSWCIYCAHVCFFLLRYNHLLVHVPTNLELNLTYNGL